MIAFLLCLLPWSFAAKVDVPWLPTRYAVFSVGFTFVSLCMAHAFQKAHATDDLIISSLVQTLTRRLISYSSLSFPLEANFGNMKAGYILEKYSTLSSRHSNEIRGILTQMKFFLTLVWSRRTSDDRIKNYKNVLPTSGWCERSEWLVCWVALAWSQWLGFQWGSTDRDSAELAEEMLQSKHLVLKSNLLHLNCVSP